MSRSGFAFARALVATTDRLFHVIAGSGWASSFFRAWLMPHGMPVALKSALGRRTAFRELSQIRIAYRHSPLSEGKAGNIAGGDRLPWIGDIDNFAPLTTLAWQLHAFEGVEHAFLDGAASMQLQLHRFPFY